MPNVDPSNVVQELLITIYAAPSYQSGHYHVDSDVPGYFRSNNKVVYGQLNYRPEWFDVKLLGSHQKIVADNYFDFDGTRVPFIEFGAPGQFAKVTTGELQMVSKPDRSDEHTYELQALLRISYAVFGLKTKQTN